MNAPVRSSQTLASAALLRRANGLRVVEAIVRHGEISRAELSRQLALSKQTVSEIVGFLESRSWVVNAGQSQGKLGRTAQTYAINPAAGRVLGVDLEGQRLVAVLADMAGTPLATAQARTAARTDRLLAQIDQLTQRLCDQAGVARQEVAAMAVGCPGVVDPATQRIHHSPNLPQLARTDLRAALAERLGLPVLLDNDVNFAALGEAWRGSLQGRHSGVLLRVGSGVGMGVMLQGRLWRGFRGHAGEIGYLALPGWPQGTDARAHGALEATLLAAVQALQDAGFPHSRSAAARKALDQLADSCAFALAAAWLMVAPELLVLSGPVFTHEAVVDAVRQRLGSAFSEPIQLQAGLLGEQAGLQGAVASAIQWRMDQLFSVD